MPDLQIIKFINLTLAILWIYQGLVPKVLFINTIEIQIWEKLGLTVEHAITAGRLSGVVEILFGISLIFISRYCMHILNILALLGLLLLIIILMPTQLIQGFNPVVMNIAMISLSVIYFMLINPKNLTFKSIFQSNH